VRVIQCYILYAVGNAIIIILQQSQQLKMKILETVMQAQILMRYDKPKEATLKRQDSTRMSRIKVQIATSYVAK
jgi:hypothetical protein